MRPTVSRSHLSGRLLGPRPAPGSAPVLTWPATLRRRGEKGAGWSEAGGDRMGPRGGWEWETGFCPFP